MDNITVGDKDYHISKNGEIIQYSLNTKIWTKDGVLHRDNDLPAVIHANGSEEWWFNGKRHRNNNLPAIIKVNGVQEWWVNGIRHRDVKDGPAVLSPNVYKCGWYVNGVNVSKKIICIHSVV